MVTPEAATPASAGPLAPPVVSAPVAHAPEKGRTFVVFFDDVHVGPAASETVRQQLAGFLARELRDGDQVTIRAPLRGIEWTARTAYERSRLPDVIEKMQGHFVRDPFHDQRTDFDIMKMLEDGYAPQAEARGISGNDPIQAPLRSFNSTNPYVHDRYAIARRRIRRSLTALREAIVSLNDVPGRKSVIFYSEGFIHAPGMADYDQAIDAARRAHVAVYFVDPRGLRTGLAGPDGSPTGRNPVMEMDMEAGGISLVASATGGRRSMSNDVTALFAEAMVESDAYYLIGFQPTSESGERRIRVRVRGDGRTVRAPDRYSSAARSRRR